MRERQARRRASPLSLYMPVYFLALMGAMMTRIISMSASWRASWVFHAAPLRRYDQFYSGVLWGVLYGLVLPAAALIGLALLAVWRDPLHVAAHLALPCGIALLSFPIAMQFDAPPPFSQEPQRHRRSKEIAFSAVVTTFLIAVGAAQYAERSHPVRLVGIGLALSGLALALWSLANRRIRTSMRMRPFEG